MLCSFYSPYKLEKNFIIHCIIQNTYYNKLNNYYIQPFYYTIQALSPFEIIIKNPIKNMESIPEPEKKEEVPSDSDKDDDDDNDTIFIVIISILGFIILVFIFIIIILVRRSKQKDFLGGPLLKKEEMETKI